MKTYEQLSKSEQKSAVAYFTERLLENIAAGSIRFNDKLNEDTLQARIDKAIKKAEAMKTPWFASEYIMDMCRDEIEGMAAYRIGRKDQAIESTEYLLKNLKLGGNYDRRY